MCVHGRRSVGGRTDRDRAAPEAGYATPALVYRIPVIGIAGLPGSFGLVSALTKIFIVLLVLFSIAFSSMTISIVAQSANWKDTATKFEEQARISDTNLRHEIAASAAQLASALDEARSNIEEIGRLEADVEKARQNASGFQAQLAKSESEKGSAEAMNRGLLAQLQLVQVSSDEYRKQRTNLERRAIDVRRRNIDLNDRVNEMTEQIDVFLEQRRHF